MGTGQWETHAAQMFLLPRAGGKSWSLGQGQEACTEGAGRHGAMHLCLEGLFLMPWAALTCGATAALLLQRTGLRGSPWVQIHLLGAPLCPGEEGSGEKAPEERACMEGWA